eukprot:150828-Rhodomonas_salina.1
MPTQQHQQERCLVSSPVSHHASLADLTHPFSLAKLTASLAPQSHITPRSPPSQPASLLASHLSHPPLALRPATRLIMS